MTKKTLTRKSSKTLPSKNTKVVKKILKSYLGQFLPRWAVFNLDMVLILITFVFSYLLRFNFNYSQINPYDFEYQVVVVGLVYMLAFFITRSFSGIIRHTGFVDIFRILQASSFSLFLLVLFTSVIYEYNIGSLSQFAIPYSVIIIHFLLSLFALIGSRALIRNLFSRLTRQNNSKKVRVVIYGAGAAGRITKEVLSKDENTNYQVVAFIDDNPNKTGKRLDGIQICSFYQALSSSFISKHSVSLMIISIQELRLEKKKKIIEKGLELHLMVKVTPPAEMLINGQFNSRQLRNIKIEDLLEREPIKLDKSNVNREIENKTIMITGGAGSIGREIVRQILKFSPGYVIVVDQAESALFELRFELESLKSYSDQFHKIEFVIASVKDKFRMNTIFDTYRPDIIYHAAAYKHVPLMEQNPYEALMVNVFGTKVIADLSVKYEAEKFVMISTDKAINPTNVMGASKRIAEIYIQSLPHHKTKFITTRFGNVLGSNGSVVPIFKKQIEAGGPVTITHKDITRYFMTIPEACNLVLEAGAMGNGSDIFIFDMGEPVKIDHLARKMIQLYHFEPDYDIEIVETGLRPGEKLYEELLNNKEITLPTHHPKIKRTRVTEVEPGKVNRFIEELGELILDKDDFKLVNKMKKFVPEYISNNSVYEKLDKSHKKK